MLPGLSRTLSGSEDYHYFTALQKHYLNIPNRINIARRILSYIKNNLRGIYLMNILKLITMLCLIGMTSATVLAANETVDLGPVNIYLDLECVGLHAVETKETTIENHKEPKFQYEIYPADIIFNGTKDKMLLEVHRMNAAEPLNDAISERDPSSGLEHCLMRSDIIWQMDSPENSTENRVRSSSESLLDSLFALFSNSHSRSNMMHGSQNMQTESYAIDGKQGILATISSDPKNPKYIVAWSPDQKGQTGTIVCLVGSYLPWETTKKIFDSVSATVL
jgi:hypothetical protein